MYLPLQLRSYLATPLLLFALILPLQSKSAEKDWQPVLKAPKSVGEGYDVVIQTPDEDINAGAALALRALWDGAVDKAGIIVPTVCGIGTHYPHWVHPYDNYWINRVASYLFPRESTEWPIRLFASYQSPLGEILGGVYHIPTTNWRTEWEKVDGPKKWQGFFARPFADHAALMAKEPEKIQYGIYVRDHLFVLQVYDQWRARGHFPFLIEMYGPCRKALKYLEKHHDLDHNGLIETTCVLSDLVVAGDKDINSTERAEDQVMLYGALRAFAEMADSLGGVEDSAWARTWAKRVMEGLNALMWRSEGRYMFGLDRASKKPRLEYVTTTFANGYAILFGMTSEEQTTAILDFMAKQEFVVPGPYHIPPVRAEDKPQNPPGVYCNGGCGWGRGIMPSVALACFEHGHSDQGLDYLKRQAVAARKAGSFHEYWTWEKYTGKTEAGGAPWYGETSAGYLDVLLHGLFGLSTTEPGFKTLRLTPRFPKSWRQARLELRLPQGNRLAVRYRAREKSVSLTVQVDAAMPVTVDLPWQDGKEPEIEGTGIAKSGIVRSAQGFHAICQLNGSGEIRLTSK